jgi:hypothetical protein
MKNYVNLIAFEEGTDFSAAIELLKNNGFNCEETTCYIAAMKEEASQTLDSSNLNITESNINKVLKDLEEDDHIWESLEEAVSEIINDEKFVLEAE